MKIQDKTLKEYFESENTEDEIHAFQYVRKADALQIGSALTWPFGVVKDLQSAKTVVGYVEAVATIKKIDKSGVLASSAYAFAATLKYMIEEMKVIAELEKTISRKQSAAEAAADGRGLSALGAYIQISELAGGDVTKIRGVLDTEYSLCFAELKYRFELAQYRKQVAEIDRQLHKQ